MRKTEMWGRQRAECLKPPHLVTVFSCHHCTETPGGLCEALLVCVCKWKMSSKIGEKGSRISGRKNETTVPHLSENIWKCDISATAEHILPLDTMECGYFNNIKLFHHVLFRANDRQQWNPHQSKWKFLQSSRITLKLPRTLLCLQGLKITSQGSPCSRVMCH